MDKKILTRLLVPAAILAIAVLWLLKELPATAANFGWFTLEWAATIILGALGATLLLSGIFAPNDVVVRKSRIYAGAGVLIGAFFCLTTAIIIPDNIVIPIVAIIVASAVFIAVLFTGGRKWDSGDNQKVGYKNYRQRKAEAEKQEKRSK